MRSWILAIVAMIIFGFLLYKSGLLLAAVIIAGAIGNLGRCSRMTATVF